MVNARRLRVSACRWPAGRAATSRFPGLKTAARQLIEKLPQPLVARDRADVGGLVPGQHRQHPGQPLRDRAIALGAHDLHPEH